MTPLTWTHLGFTGTRQGMTRAQAAAVTALLQACPPQTFHHSDALGAETEVHALVRQQCPATQIMVHPPTRSAQRSFCVADIWRPTLPYFLCQQAVVQASDVLLAVPQSAAEMRRSGCWQAVQYARAVGTPVVLVRATGQVVWPPTRQEVAHG